MHQTIANALSGMREGRMHSLEHGRLILCHCLLLVVSFADAGPCSCVNIVKEPATRRGLLGGAGDKRLEKVFLMDPGMPRIVMNVKSNKDF